MPPLRVGGVGGAALFSSLLSEMFFHLLFLYQNVAEVGGVRPMVLTAQHT